MNRKNTPYYRIGGVGAHVCVTRHLTCAAMLRRCNLLCLIACLRVVTHAQDIRPIGPGGSAAPLSIAKNGYLQACFQPVRATSVSGCETNSGNLGLVAQHPVLAPTKCDFYNR